MQKTEFDRKRPNLTEKDRILFKKNTERDKTLQNATKRDKKKYKKRQKASKSVKKRQIFFLKNLAEKRKE